MGALLYGSEAENLGTLASEDWTSNLTQMANMAQEYFVSKGVSPSNETGESKAESKPVATTDLKNQ
jgi:hypothetical protein